MEVHHHPNVEKKRFKEYFLEFLMIFLAVTMGFFAESIRENISDEEHVKQLARQLVQDLKNDTIALRNIDSSETRIVARTDTLIHLLESPLASADLKRIQELTVDCYSYFPFYPSQGGINAIKNEFRLKQFSNSEIGDYITKYERRTAVMLKIQEYKSNFLTTNVQGFIRLHLKPDNLDSALSHHPVLNAEVRNLTQADMEQLSVDLVLIKNLNQDLITYNRYLKDQALELIKYTTRQYHLEKE
jgi:hypothetical protein